MSTIQVIGGGLAGCEAAWQLAELGFNVILYEMRPLKWTGAHKTALLAELVCSNSLGSNLWDRSSGLLKQELRRIGSLLIECADKTSVPAGSALAVDRNAFSELVTRNITFHSNIHVKREEVECIPAAPTIIASGPLTSVKLSEDLQDKIGEEHLFFYDAISPIVQYESINMDIAYRGSRYERGDNTSGDYINCPFTEHQYELFVNELITAKTIELPAVDAEIFNTSRPGIHKYFEGCLPVEIIAGRGKDALAFGPMRPVGLVNPKTGKIPYAVVQLRQDNILGSLYNMVGFQTNLKYGEQERIFHLIPGLEGAVFERYGEMHRNTFINAPKYLYPTLQSKFREDIFFAGQITGVEGYVGNIGTGLLAGQNIARHVLGLPLIKYPNTTMLGALCYYISNSDEKNFQPMKSNFGILPPILDKTIRGKRGRGAAYAQRALKDLDIFLTECA
jgi:methylenetetrahydrofolate--tRNA-(uracil-5-)-methyltransferase